MKHISKYTTVIALLVLVQFFNGCALFKEITVNDKLFLDSLRSKGKLTIINYKVYFASGNGLEKEFLGKDVKRYLDTLGKEVVAAIESELSVDSSSFCYLKRDSLPLTSFDMGYHLNEDAPAVARLTGRDSLVAFIRLAVRCQQLGFKHIIMASNWEIVAPNGEVKATVSINEEAANIPMKLSIGMYPKIEDQVYRKPLVDLAIKNAAKFVSLVNTPPK